MELAIGLGFLILVVWIVISVIKGFVSGIKSVFRGSNPPAVHQTVSQSSQSNEDELVTFRISVTSDEPKSRNTTPGQWVPKGQHQTIKSVEINDGLFYAGGRLASLAYDGETESSLVDPTLEIEAKPLEYQDDSLGYWPKFITISPQCRGAYLSWLASRRDNPKAPLGYVFIYFYGMERRVLVDARKGEVGDDEFAAIFKELLRLKGIYGRSRSFDMYVARLLEIMVLFRPKVVKLPAAEWDSGRYELLVRYQLARLVTSGAAIPARLALLWLIHSEIYRLRTPAKRCRQCSPSAVSGQAV